MACPEPTWTLISTRFLWRTCRRGLFTRGWGKLWGVVPCCARFEAALALLFARLARAGRRKLLYLYYAGRTVKNYCSRRTVSRVLCVCQPSFRVSEMQGRDKKIRLLISLFSLGSGCSSRVIWRHV
ncbi:hypothetical protein GQ55_5G158500 [Panicum hallii var. hallii]|uniref:Uncharacterized protein n=1 Tax=Panicum hallii var. hallii TaxID=1504633 RepID=A0A2T7DGS3_9POAL|nr:hypothetical protein GQ55_5G158500 [Panicum hallii var. hallii]